MAVLYRKGQYRIDHASAQTVVTSPDDHVKKKLEAEKKQELLEQQYLQGLEKKIADLNAQIEATKQQGVEEAEEAYQRGVNEGLEKGIQAGFDKAQEVLIPNIQSLSQLLVKIESTVENIWDACRVNAARTVILICRKIIGMAAEDYEPLVVDLAGRIFSEIKDNTHVNVFVNEADHQVLREAQERLISATDGVKSIEIMTRKGLSRGSVIVETEIRQFDGRLEEQLSTIESNLLPSWSRSREVKLTNDEEASSDPSVTPVSR